MPLILVEDLERDEERVVQSQQDDQIVPVLDEAPTASEEKLFALDRFRGLNRAADTLPLTVLTGTRAIVAFNEDWLLPVVLVGELLLRLLVIIICWFLLDCLVPLIW